MPDTLKDVATQLYDYMCARCPKEKSCHELDKTGCVVSYNCEKMIECMYEKLMPIEKVKRLIELHKQEEKVTFT